MYDWIAFQSIQSDAMQSSARYFNNGERAGGCGKETLMLYESFMEKVLCVMYSIRPLLNFLLAHFQFTISRIFSSMF